MDRQNAFKKKYYLLACYSFLLNIKIFYMVMKLKLTLVLLRKIYLQIIGFYLYYLIYD